MCGLAGFVDRAGVIPDPLRALASMADALRHRGPDEEGLLWREESRVGLAFRRLAVQDTSSAGHQPMVSPSERYTVVFNGEIYNFNELRGACGRTAFRGHSDTEVMLALFDRLGVRETLDRLAGMFAFAVWDERDRELTLVRDRLGVKPLYVGLTGVGEFALGGTLPPGRSLAFASEIKALRPLSAMHFGIDPAALALFVRHSYVPTPWTIHGSIRKLPPGHILRLRGGCLSCERYWCSKSIVERSATFTGTFEDAAAEAGSLLETSVRQRMIADVPTGVFLSGGIDSSVVAATMSKVSSGRVRAFTIAMEESRYDEADRAERVAKHLGLDHTVLRFTADEALRLVPQLPEIWDEPFADSSQLATHLVARLARSHVTVALSGDGGDEVFGGYERYRRVPMLWQAFGRMPTALRSPLATILEAIAPALESIAGDRIHKVAPLLRESSAWEMFRRLTSVVPDPSELLVTAPERTVPLTDSDWLIANGSIERRMMQADLVSYLVDDILVKVDRATMAVGLEAREPLLDHRLVEFTFGWPPDFLVRRGVTKPILRHLLSRDLPSELIGGPKRGFAVPLHAWLCGPLRGWADDLLSDAKLKRGGRFRPDAVRNLWAAVLRGDRLEHRIWNVLMVEAWAERWGA
jgi:asparagine synthase (glutamine-hydrolysing)